MESTGGRDTRLRGPADQRTVRDHNLALVLQHVDASIVTSRAQLAAHTGLNKTTVSSLVNELMERRLLTEGGVQRNGEVGRPAVRVQLDGECWVALGMEVNVDSLGWAIVDLQGRVRDEGHQIHDNRTRTPKESLEALAAAVTSALERTSRAGLVPMGAAIGLPGLVDADRHDLLVAPNLGWTDVPASELLGDLLATTGLEVLVDNEANLAALAERWHGVGRELDDFVHISGEVGVGAGVIIKGALHRGSVGFGGELGHMTLEPDGAPCACGGRGCVETRVGLEAVLRAAGFDVSETLGGQADGVSPAQRLADAARAGDERVLAALADAGSALGTALASSINLLSPDGIVLGGYFGSLHEWLGPAIEVELLERVLSERHRPTRVLRSSLDHEATARGAAEVVIREALAGPSAIVAPG